MASPDRVSRIAQFRAGRASRCFSLLPLLLLIAIAIKLTSRGPVLYTQERVGLDRRTPGVTPGNHRRVRDIGGKPFTIYKFRTMRVDAEAHSGAVWATQNDPRVTPVGRFLRQYRLDEIPQLLNVMRGEMNIVGPRPERPTIFAELREHITEYPLRQRAKPGITGLAQIYHHYDRSMDDVRTKVRFDLEYIRRQSLREDLRIMLKHHPGHPLPTRRLVADCPAERHPAGATSTMVAPVCVFSRGSSWRCGSPPCAAGPAWRPRCPSRTGRLRL